MHVPGENEVNVRYALDKHPCLDLMPQLPHIGDRGIAGCCEPAAQEIPGVPWVLCCFADFDMIL